MRGKANKKRVGNNSSIILNTLRQGRDNLPTHNYLQQMYASLDGVNAVKLMNSGLDPQPFVLLAGDKDPKFNSVLAFENKEARLLIAYFLRKSLEQKSDIKIENLITNLVKDKALTTDAIYTDTKANRADTSTLYALWRAIRSATSNETIDPILQKGAQEICNRFALNYFQFFTKIAIPQEDAVPAAYVARFAIDKDHTDPRRKTLVQKIIKRYMWDEFPLQTNNSLADAIYTVSAQSDFVPFNKDELAILAPWLKEESKTTGDLRYHHYASALLI